MSLLKAGKYQDNQKKINLFLGKKKYKSDMCSLE